MVLEAGVYLEIFVIITRRGRLSCRSGSRLCYSRRGLPETRIYEEALDGRRSRRSLRKRVSRFDRAPGGS